MNNFNISIFNNKTFFEIIKEIKLFSKYKINHYEDLDSCVKDAENENRVVIFFSKFTEEMNKYNFPSILATESMEQVNRFSNNLNEQIKIPFSILSFKEKIFQQLQKVNLKKIH